MFNFNVTVSPTATGAVIQLSRKNPEYGYIKVEQTVPVMGANSWVRSQTRTALIKGTVEELQALSYKALQALPGRIVVKESLIPIRQDDSLYGLKIAGETGVVCRVDDQPIYRQTIYTTDKSVKDELIQHTNSDEIKQKQALLKNL